MAHLTFEEMQQRVAEQADAGGRMSFEDMRKATQAPRAREVEPEPASLFDKAMARLQGTDVDDPAPITRAAATLTGALVGTAVGVRAGAAVAPALGPAGPVAVFGGALLFGAAGAITGSVSPEFTVEIAEALGYAEPGTRERKLLSNEDLRTVAEGEGLLDLAFGSVMQTAVLVGRVTGSTATGVGKAERALAARAGAGGIELTPAMLQTTAFSRFFVPVFGRFPFIGGPLRRSGRLADKQIKELIEELPQRIAPVISESDIGVRIFRNARTLVKKVGKDFGAKYEKLFAKADDLGVVVAPKTLLHKADDILTQIERAVPPKLVKGKVVPGTPGDATRIARDFITKEIMPLRAVVQGNTMTLSLTLRQMDGLLGKLDEALSAVEPAQRKFVSKLFQQLKTAGQKDTVVNLRGPGAEEFGTAMRDLDTEFSQTIRFLFETPAAKRFATVRRKGLRGVVADPATTVPIDKVYKNVVDLESPQIMDQLSRIVSKKAYRQIVARTLDDELSKGLKFDPVSAQTIFNPEPVLRGLGALRRSPAKLTTLDLMLRRAGGVRLAEVETVLAAARGLARSAIPDMNAFIARRGTIGGAGAIMRGLLPGVAVAGGAAAGSGQDVPILGGILGMLVFIGGGNAVARLMTNPRTAQPLRLIASGTASRAGRHTAYIRIVRAMGVALREDAAFPEQWADGITRAMEDTVKYWISFEDAAARGSRRILTETTRIVDRIVGQRTGGGAPASGASAP